MLPLLFALALLLPLPQQPEGKPVNAAMKRNEMAVSQLIAAFDGEDPTLRAAALTRSGHLPDKRVIRIDGIGLHDKHLSVRRAAIEALRFNENPSALHLLQVELDKGIQPGSNEEATAALIRGLCQKADSASLPALNKLEIDPASRELRRAWILGLGRLRDKDSISALMEFIELAPQGRRSLFMSDVRLSLMVLSGTDQGLDADAWLRWWRRVGEKFNVAPFDPQLPQLVALDWYDYWNLDQKSERKQQLQRAQSSAKKGGDKGTADPQKARKRSRRNPQANSWPADKEG